MDIIKIAAVILVCTILVSALYDINKSIVSLVYISTAVIITSYVLAQAKQAIGSVINVVSLYGNTDFTLIFKVMGISLVTQFVSDIAADMGNKSLSNQMLFAGKRAIIVLAMPIFTKVLEIIGKLLE